MTGIVHSWRVAGVTFNWPHVWYQCVHTVELHQHICQLCKNEAFERLDSYGQICGNVSVWVIELFVWENVKLKLLHWVTRSSYMLLIIYRKILKMLKTNRNVLKGLIFNIYKKIFSNYIKTTNNNKMGKLNTLVQPMQQMLMNAFTQFLYFINHNFLGWVGSNQCPT